METNKNNDLNFDDELTYKLLVKQGLIALIKSKNEGFDDTIYDTMLKNFALLKDEQGEFHIVTPILDTSKDGLIN
ncbi:hypothetical protein RRF68_08015 [Tenacibaculum sp. HL-MS23]|uniref:hypothetical protein n=1 Tax=Tenacibaculum sp. HL-MS23 TaxID=3077734 RepID=UPI0028FC1081|nr:hypothetical protein [Tenacibaculum sp. HL-MS23]WNW00941.1 hypothetical protein RRF68_08015 [Tenacibaculum sp. HL-MS23]